MRGWGKGGVGEKERKKTSKAQGIHKTGLTWTWNKNISFKNFLVLDIVNIDAWGELLLKSSGSLWNTKACLKDMHPNTCITVHVLGFCFCLFFSNNVRRISLKPNFCQYFGYI